MKTILSIFLLFVTLQSVAQDDEDYTDSFKTTRGGFGNQSGFNMGPEFINAKIRTDGSAYYFEDWDAEAMIYLKEQGRYKIEAANINLLDNAFEALYDENKVYTFDTKNILQIIIKDKIFRTISFEGEPTLLELFFNEKVTVYKHYSINYSKSSPNPMVNRKTNKFIRNERYYIEENGRLNKIKLTKRGFAKQFATKDRDRDAIETYIEVNNISLNDENEFRQLLNYVGK